MAISGGQSIELIDFELIIGRLLGLVNLALHEKYGWISRPPSSILYQLFIKCIIMNKINSITSGNHHPENKLNFLINII